MKSPRFDNRAGALKAIFSPHNLETVWKEKVRVSMRQQFVHDGIEHFDFHVSRKLECKKLSELILGGDYVPDRAQRILVEKSKGLCRQLVIPSAKDALVLQCLSDSLYLQIRGQEPTKKAFFEPQEHRFSSVRSRYGTFAAWLNFQRELFDFSKTRAFIVVTDIANYYDSISYAHLRNVIASRSGGIAEPVLDMLIYILSDLLWQPDYMPRVEIGLPQINLDAPRLLAHCFLYELDEFLGSDPNRDFVRFMDDIDVGVDSVPEAKNVLKSIDLVLQTKQVRLNSGKTLILTQTDALRHFRVLQNARLDLLQGRIKNRRTRRLGLTRDKWLIEQRIQRGLANRAFDDGNGEKILKRWISLAASVGAYIRPADLHRLLLLRPAVRENVCAYISRQDLMPARADILAQAAASGHLVDDAAMVDLVNYLVETAVRTTAANRHNQIMRISAACDITTYFGLYNRLWLQSKYDSPARLLATISAGREKWVVHERLGRLVGSLAPLFSRSPEEPAYFQLLSDSRNPGARDTYKFHVRLREEVTVFRSMYDALKSPNPSRGTGITHAKFLCLLSALQNTKAPLAQKKTLKKNHVRTWRDAYYLRIGRRLGI